MLRRTLVAVAAFAGLEIEIAHADTRGTFRLGVMPLDLVSSAETPVFGGDLERAVDNYNAAAAARDRMSGGTTARLDTSDLGVAETLVVFTPGLELGSHALFFRLEAPIGIADDLTSIGLALYPLNVQLALRRNVVIYGSAGGSASWLDRPGSGDIGGLVAARGAVGLRLARRFILEVGYNAFMLGGSINNERLANMAEAAVLPDVQPDEVISAGEARGIVDASLGIVF